MTILQSKSLAEGIAKIFSAELGDLFGAVIAHTKVGHEVAQLSAKAGGALAEAYIGPLLRLVLKTVDNNEAQLRRIERKLDLSGIEPFLTGTRLALEYLDPSESSEGEAFAKQRLNNAINRLDEAYTRASQDDDSDTMTDIRLCQSLIAMRLGLPEHASKYFRFIESEIKDQIAHAGGLAEGHEAMARWLRGEYRAKDEWLLSAETITEMEALNESESQGREEDHRNEAAEYRDFARNLRLLMDFVLESQVPVKTIPHPTLIVSGGVPQSQSIFYYPVGSAYTRCRLAIFNFEHYVAALATQLYGPWPSITNCIEHLATEIVRRYQIRPAGLCLVEHYPPREDRYCEDERFSLVSFTWHYRCAKAPRWKPITRADAENIIGWTIPDFSHNCD